MKYEEFLASKHVSTASVGIEVSQGDLNKSLFDWQAKVVSWALRKGRAALFEDCGLGKCIQSLAWADALYRLKGVNSIYFAPVAVGPQVIREARKFGIESPVNLVTSDSDVQPGICVTNYEKLHKFDLSRFQAVVLDESSILKSYTGTTKRALCEAFERHQYKLCCTATPAPNDHMELGNHAEFLGIMPSNQMLARWFINDTMKAGGYRVAKHAWKDFWRWVASWSVGVQKPSNIGFADEGYSLPPLRLHEVVVDCTEAPAGWLIDVGTVVTATTVHQEKRRSLQEKVAEVEKLVRASPDEPWAIWCDTDYEADALMKALPEAVEVRGSHSERVKEERLTAFSDGDAKWIITKPEIGGFGLNWQHCCKTVCFANFSFERWYQLIRRLYRFGQTKPVDCWVVASAGEMGVLSTLRRKQEDYDVMIREMVSAMKEGMAEELDGALPLAKYQPTVAMALPEYLYTHEDAA